MGEHIREAAIREIKEETGLDVKLRKTICAMEIIAPHAEYHRVVFFHLAEPLTNEMKASDDTSECRFFSPKEIENLRIGKSVIHVLKVLGININAEPADRTETKHICHVLN